MARQERYVGWLEHKTKAGDLTRSSISSGDTADEALAGVAAYLPTMNLEYLRERHVPHNVVITRGPSQKLVGRYPIDLETRKLIEKPIDDNETAWAMAEEDFSTGRDRWHEITEKLAMYLLGVVPPIRGTRGRWFVGEAWTHNARGAVHLAVRQDGDRFFVRMMNVVEAQRPDATPRHSATS